MTSRVGLVVRITYLVSLSGLVLDLIIEAISNTENQILAAIVDSMVKQDTKSNFFMKLVLGWSLLNLRIPTFGLPIISRFIYCEWGPRGQ
jgi:hypothetical protein